MGMTCQEEWQCIAGCSDRGVCSLGQCTCDQGFMGVACQHSVPKCPSELKCKNGGMCFNGECSCPAGYTGYDCGKRQNCGTDFVCKNSGTCNVDNGKCLCSPLWRGYDCSQELRTVLISRKIPEPLQDTTRLSRRTPN
eukprot:c12195_g1_i4.p2 GENE.c12195_g1_i4~~c12195_g1_i4.p2  ORF type:complete len:138 (+),score=14.68 c12195_g1_i4:1593-2006(+)